MLRCKGCGVTVRGAPERCPLCQGQLEGAGEASAFPSGGEAPAPRLLFPLITLIAIIAGVTCVAVNFLAPGEAWWSLFALAGIGGAWVCVGIALRTRSNLLKNIVWQVFLISGFAVVLDVCIGWRGWSISYVLPLVCIAAMAAMAALNWILRLPPRDFIVYCALGCLFGVVPVIFVCTGVLAALAPSVVCIAFSVVFWAALLLFYGPAMWQELKKKFTL